MSAYHRLRTRRARLDDDDDGGAYVRSPRTAAEAQESASIDPAFPGTRFLNTLEFKRIYLHPNLVTPAAASLHTDTPQRPAYSSAQSRPDVEAVELPPNTVTDVRAVFDGASSSFDGAAPRKPAVPATAAAVLRQHRRRDKVDPRLQSVYGVLSASPSLAVNTRKVTPQSQVARSSGRAVLDPNAAQLHSAERGTVLPYHAPPSTHAPLPSQLRARVKGARRRSATPALSSAANAIGTATATPERMSRSEQRSEAAWLSMTRELEDKNNEVRSLQRQLQRAQVLVRAVHSVGSDVSEKSEEDDEEKDKEAENPGGVAVGIEGEASGAAPTAGTPKETATAAFSVSARPRTYWQRRAYFLETQNEGLTVELEKLRGDARGSKARALRREIEALRSDLKASRRGGAAAATRVKRGENCSASGAAPPNKHGDASGSSDDDNSSNGAQPAAAVSSPLPWTANANDERLLRQKDATIRDLQERLQQLTEQYQKTASQLLRVSRQLEDVTHRYSAVQTERRALQRLPQELAQVQQQMHRTQAQLLEADRTVEDFHQVFDSMESPATLQATLGERDRLVELLRQSQQREAAIRDEAKASQQQALREVEARYESQLAEERAMAHDREAQQKQAAQRCMTQVQNLQGQLTRQRETYEAELTEQARQREAELTARLLESVSRPEASRLDTPRESSRSAAASGAPSSPYEKAAAMSPVVPAPYGPSSRPPSRDGPRHAPAPRRTPDDDVERGKDTATALSHSPDSSTAPLLDPRPTTALGLKKKRSYEERSNTGSMTRDRTAMSVKASSSHNSSIASSRVDATRVVPIGGSFLGPQTGVDALESPLTSSTSDSTSHTSSSISEDSTVPSTFSRGSDVESREKSSANRKSSSSALTASCPVPSAAPPSAAAAVASFAPPPPPSAFVPAPPLPTVPSSSSPLPSSSAAHETPGECDMSIPLLSVPETGEEDVRTSTSHHSSSSSAEGNKANGGAISLHSSGSSSLEDEDNEALEKTIEKRVPDTPEPQSDGASSVRRPGDSGDGAMDLAKPVELKAATASSTSATATATATATRSTTVHNHLFDFPAPPIQIVHPVSILINRSAMPSLSFAAQNNNLRAVVYSPKTSPQQTATATTDFSESHPVASNSDDEDSSAYSSSYSHSSSESDSAASSPSTPPLEATHAGDEQDKKKNGGTPEDAVQNTKSDDGDAKTRQTGDSLVRLMATQKDTDSPASGKQEATSAELAPATLAATNITSPPHTPILAPQQYQQQRASTLTRPADNLLSSFSPPPSQAASPEAPGPNATAAARHTPSPPALPQQLPPPAQQPTTTNVTAIPALHASASSSPAAVAIRASVGAAVPIPSPPAITSLVASSLYPPRPGSSFPMLSIHLDDDFGASGTGGNITPRATVASPRLPSTEHSSVFDLTPQFSGNASFDFVGPLAERHRLEDMQNALNSHSLQTSPATTPPLTLGGGGGVSAPSNTSNGSNKNSGRLPVATGATGLSQMPSPPLGSHSVPPVHLFPGGKVAAVLTPALAAEHGETGDASSRAATQVDAPSATREYRPASPPSAHNDHDATKKQRGSAFEAAAAQAPATPLPEVTVEEVTSGPLVTPPGSAHPTIPLHSELSEQEQSLAVSSPTALVEEPPMDAVQLMPAGHLVEVAPPPSAAPAAPAPAASVPSFVPPPPLGSVPPRPPPSGIIVPPPPHAVVPAARPARSAEAMEASPLQQEPQPQPRRQHVAEEGSRTVSVSAVTAADSVLSLTSTPMETGTLSNGDHGAFAPVDEEEDEVSSNPAAAMGGTVEKATTPPEPRQFEDWTTLGTGDADAPPLFAISTAPRHPTTSSASFLND